MLLFKRFSSSFQRISTVYKTSKPGDSLGVKGWIQNIRRMKKNIFLDISDGSTSESLQIVVPKTESTKAITSGSSIKASGNIQISPNGKYELHAEDVNVIAEGNMANGYPFTPKQQHPPDYVREHLHLRSRVDYFASVMRLRHKALKGIHDFMDKHDFVQIHTPIITTNDCEGAGEVFEIKPDNVKLLKEMSRVDVPLEHSYFDNKVFLSVSGQLHLEAMSYGLGNTYTISPAFRAENSKSPLHLSEFYMFEAEIAFAEELPQIVQFIENMLKSITTSLLDSSAENIHHCQKNAVGSTFKYDWLDRNWTTLTYDAALTIINDNKNKFKTKVNPEQGFSKEQELFLVNHCKTPVFVVDWPIEQKPFYMRISEPNTERVQALDLLMPNVGELCGGGLREWHLKNLCEHPRYPKGLNWYQDLRKYGGIPTGGFGMGFERYLQLLTGIKNIRDVIPYPRYPHSCKM